MNLTAIIGIASNLPISIHAAIRIYLVFSFCLVTLTCPAQNTKEPVGIPPHFNALRLAYPDHCIVSGNTHSKMIALTFDDGPTEITPQVVKIMEEYGVKATFFWQGQNIIKHAYLVKEIAKTHQIANHSWDHQNGFESTPSHIWDTQVKPTFESLALLGLGKPVYYRPPFGAITGDQIKYLAQNGIKTILWSLSTLDWDMERNSTKEIFNRFKQHIHPGAIVLLHDQTFNDDGQMMLEGLQQILQYGQEKGYVFVTLDTLLAQ